MMGTLSMDINHTKGWEQHQWFINKIEKINIHQNGVMIRMYMVQKDTQQSVERINKHEIIFS